MIINQVAAVPMNHAAEKDCAVNVYAIIGVWVSYLGAYSHQKLSVHMTGRWKGLLLVITNELNLKMNEMLEIMI
jgi:hypothetical protein